MKKYTRVIVALTFLLELGVGANAQTQPVANVILPFKFVVGKTTFPAGKYIVKRISAQPFDVLMLTSYDKGTSVFVNPIEMESTSAYNPKLSFRMVGEQHYLSRIQTADYVYNFRSSGSATLAAAVKPHDTVSVSVSGGSK
jgi:hypothetical protein